MHPKIERILYTKSHVILIGLFAFQCIFLFFYEIYFSLKVDSTNKSSTNQSNKIFKIYCEIAYTLVAICFAYYSIILKNIYELFLFLGMSTYSVVINSYEVFLCIEDKEKACISEDWLAFITCIPLWIPQICFFALAYFVYKNFKYEKFKSRRSDLTKKEKRTYTIHYLFKSSMKGSLFAVMIQSFGLVFFMVYDDFTVTGSFQFGEVLFPIMLFIYIALYFRGYYGIKTGGGYYIIIYLIGAFIFSIIRLGYIVNICFINNRKKSNPDDTGKYELNSGSVINIVVMEVLDILLLIFSAITGSYCVKNRKDYKRIFETPGETENQFSGYQAPLQNELMMTDDV